MTNRRGEKGRTKNLQKNSSQCILSPKTQQRFGPVICLWWCALTWCKLGQSRLGSANAHSLAGLCVQACCHRRVITHIACPCSRHTSFTNRSLHPRVIRFYSFVLNYFSFWLFYLHNFYYAYIYMYIYIYHVEVHNKINISRKVKRTNNLRWQEYNEIFWLLSKLLQLWGHHITRKPIIHLSILIQSWLLI